MSDIKQDIKITAKDETKKGYDSAAKNANSFGRTLGTLKTLMASFMAFFGLNLIADWGGKILSATDLMTSLNGKLKLATESTAEYIFAKKELIKLSLESNSQIDANITLFGRLNKSIKDLGGNTQNTLDITEVMTKGLALSHATTAEANSVILQFGQAMASGVLRGQEYNAMAEGGVRIMQALADGLGVTKGELRAMSIEGKLTADVVNTALLSQIDIIRAEADMIPVTVGRAWENINTKFKLYTEQFETGSNKISQALGFIADNFNEIADTIGTAIKVAALFYGAKSIADISNYITKLKAERAQRLANIQATEAEKMAANELAANKIKIHAIEKKQAFYDAQHAVQRHTQNIQELSDLVQKLRLTKQNVALEIEQLSLESSRSNFHLYNKRIIALKQQQVVVNKELSTANKLLKASENELTSSIELQSVAVRENTIAMVSAAKAAKVASAKVAGSVGVLTRAGLALKAVGGFLLGIPGLILYAAYEITSTFANMDGVLVALNATFKKVVAGAVLAFDILSDPSSWSDTTAKLEDYRAKIEQIDDEATQRFSDILKKEKGKQDEYEKTKQKQVQAQQEALSKIIALEKANQEEKSLLLDAELALKKSALAKHIDNKSVYEQEVLRLEQETNELKQNLLIERLNNEIKLQTEFYDKKIIAAKGDYDKVLSLETDKATQLKKISTDIVKALISDINQLTEKEISSRKRAKDVVEEYHDFVRKINGDTRTQYQKNTEAQTEQRAIEKKLRKASKEELQGNHETAKQLFSEALEDAKKLTESEQARGQSAKDESLARVQANARVQASLDLVKKATDGVKESAIKDADSAKESAQKKQEALAGYIELLKGLDSELDKKREVKVSLNSEGIYKKINDINNKIKTLSQTITITTKYTDSKSNQPDAKLATGGYPQRKNKVPGTGKGDKIKALLESGEFIMNKAATKMWGDDAMMDLNNGINPWEKVKKFASGGLASGKEYVNDLSVWLKKSQQPGQGMDALRRNKAAERVAKTLKEIISTLPNLEGKSPKVVQEVMALNGKIYKKAKDLYSMRDSMNFSKNLAERLRLKAVRDALISLPDDKTENSPIASFLQKTGLNKAPSRNLMDGPVGDAINGFAAGAERGVLSSVTQKTNPKAPTFDDFRKNSQQTININLSSGGKSTQGVFKNDSPTMQVINELKKDGFRT